MTRQQIIELLRKSGVTVEDSASNQELRNLLDQTLGESQTLHAMAGGPLDIISPPVGPGRGSAGSEGIMATYNRMVAGEERAEFRRSNFETIRRDKASLDPQNVNTIDTALSVDTLSDALVTVAANRLAPLSAISIGVSNAPLAPKRPVVLKKATSASAAQVNPTNFETGDTTLDGVRVIPAQISKSFHVTNDQAQFGFRMDDLAQINADAFTNAISDVVTGLMTTANFGAGIVIGAASAFGSDDLPAVWRVGKNFRRKNLILDGGHLASLLPRDQNAFTLGARGAYGFDLMAEHNRWTGATANTVGFICGPEALAAVASLPLTPPGAAYLRSATIQLPNNVQAAIYSWFSTNSRTLWSSYDIIFGASVCDATQGRILISA